MPTIRPKMNLVYPSEKSKQQLDALLDAKAVINGTNRSVEIIRILNASLLPDDDEFAASIDRLYRGSSTVKEELSTLFCDNSAGYDLNAKNDDLRPLVELASRQSIGAVLDVSIEKVPSPVYHLEGCWRSVCGILHRAIDDGSLPDSIDWNVCQELSAAIEEKARCIEAKAFFDLVLRNWGVLGNSTHVFRSFMDVVDMASAWPDDVRAREDFRACLWAIARDRKGE